jgi:hypothetical protein
MSEQNVETVRRVYEGVSARLEVPRELFDPGYEFDNTELWPDIGEVLGFDAAQEAMREYWETFEAYHVEIEEVIYADEGRVVDAVRDGAGTLLEDVRLFDVYTGPQIGEGRKSLTLALRFRAADRTLTEDEASAARDAAVQTAAERVGAVQRA